MTGKDTFELLSHIWIFVLWVWLIYDRAARPSIKYSGPVCLEVRLGWTTSKDGRQHMSVEVVNRGCVPVTVEEVGFKLRGQRKELTFIPVAPGDILPKVSRKPLTLVAPAEIEHNPAMKDMIGAFVRTTMGSEFTSMRPAVQDVIAKASAAGAQA